MTRFTHSTNLARLVLLVGAARGPVACSGTVDAPSANAAADSAAGALATGGSATGGQSISNARGGASSGGQSAHSGGAGGSAARGGSSVNAGGSGAVGVGGTTNTSTLDHFSFFVTSLAAIQRLAASQNGFGGDLRFGKADGLSGADEICRQAAESSMPGSSVKQWRAFLSVTKGPNGAAVNAIDRVGEGPWYDRLGRLVAATKSDLAQTRPKGADTAIINDLPNEAGVPNHNPDGMGQVDNHDTLTGSDAKGALYNTNWSCTCQDWTSAVGADGKPRVGHTWPRQIGGRTGGSALESWISALDEAGCAAGINLLETGAPNPKIPTVGSGGGYGGIYCLALTP